MDVSLNQSKPHNSLSGLFFYFVSVLEQISHMKTQATKIRLLFVYSSWQKTVH